MVEGGRVRKKDKGKMKSYHATVRMSIGDMKFPPVSYNGKAGHWDPRSPFSFIAIDQAFLETCGRPNAELSKRINSVGGLHFDIDNDWAPAVEIHGTLDESSISRWPFDESSVHTIYR